MTVVRALVLSLQPDEEDTSDDNFKYRGGKQIASSSQSSRIDSANKKVGTGTNRPNGYNVEEGHLTKNKGKRGAGSKLGPANQKGNERKEDVQARDNGPLNQMDYVNLGSYNEIGKAREEIDRHDLVAMTTDSTYAMDDEMDSESNVSNSYSLFQELSPKQRMQAGFLRIAYVENVIVEIMGIDFKNH